MTLSMMVTLTVTLIVMTRSALALCLPVARAVALRAIPGPSMTGRAIPAGGGLLCRLDDLEHRRGQGGDAAA